MAGINKVIIVGNLGNAVEMRYTQGGQAIASISVATSESWTDKNTGQKQEKTEWHRISIFGKLAEIANQYLHKGSKVYIEGQLRTNKYQKNGVDTYSTEIVVSGFGGTLQMLDKRDDNFTPSPQSAQDNQAPTNEQSSSQAEPKPPVQPLTQPDDFEDDIPF